MADINVPNSVWNGELLGQPNLIYDEFINVDIDKLPYADKLSNSGYAMISRYGYVVDRLASVDLNVVGGRWLTRDVLRKNNGNCKNEGFVYYLYQVSQDGQKYRVVSKAEGTPCAVQIIDEWFRCDCGYERFFELPFVTGIPREIKSGPSPYLSSGVASEQWGTKIYDNNLILANVEIGDYIVIYGATDESGESIVGQVRQVVGKGTVDPNTDFIVGYTKYLQLDPTFTNRPSANHLATGLEYAVFPSYDTQAIGYIAADGIRTTDTANNLYINRSIGDLSYGAGGATCIVSVQNYGGSINYLNDRGFNFYGGTGLDILSFASEDVNSLGAETISTLVYKNFVLGFSFDSIDYIAKNDIGQISIELSDEVGIKSKYAAALYKNNLLMVTRDNRLVNVGVKSDGSGLYLETQDVSDYIRGHLDNMLDTDEVFIHGDDNKLYIFINSKNDLENPSNNTTKILILNEDYKIRYTHELCSMSLSGVAYGYFYGDGLYGYFGDVDLILKQDPTSTGTNIVATEVEIQSRISAYIGDQQDNKLADSEGNSYRLMKQKTITLLKFLLGRGIYTDGNTIIKIDTYRDGYKYEKIFDTVEGVEWIDNWNSYFQGNEVLPGECFLDDLEDCDNVDRPCEGAYYNDNGLEPGDRTNRLLIADKLICTDDLDLRYQAKINDYCVCYDSRGYALSPFYNVYLSPNTKPAELFKITIYSNGRDRINFMGMLVEFVSEDYDKAEAGVNMIGETCKTSRKTCPVDNCSN